MNDKKIQEAIEREAERQLYNIELHQKIMYQGMYWRLPEAY